MKAAVVQLAPGADRTQNIQTTVRVIREAASQGAELVVLPELCTSPYQLTEEPLERWAEAIPDGETVELWQREAETLNVYLVAGLLEKSSDGYHNSALVIGPGNLLVWYRKAHLFSWERQRLAAGTSPYLTVDIQGARLGVVICYDLRFVEAIRLLALEKVQLLCVPTTWTDLGKPEPWDQYGLCAAVHLALGHAYANRLFVLCANRVGREKRVRYLGNSLIAAPSGQTLAGPAGALEEVILVAEIDPTQANHKGVGEDNNIWTDRRTDLYSISGSGKAVSPSAKI